MSSEHAQDFPEDEAQSIEYRYRPKAITNDISQIMPNVSGELVKIQDRCQKFEELSFDAGALLEEQERQLAPKMEMQRKYSALARCILLDQFSTRTWQLSYPLPTCGSLIGMKRW